MVGRFIDFSAWALRSGNLELRDDGLGCSALALARGCVPSGTKVFPTSTRSLHPAHREVP